MYAAPRRAHNQATRCLCRQWRVTWLMKFVYVRSLTSWEQRLNASQSVLGKWGGSPTAPKAFWESPDEIDVALIADALATIFRFLPQNDSVPIIMQALQPEMSDAVKISAIKACITLVTEVSETHLR